MPAFVLAEVSSTISLPPTFTASIWDQVNAMLSGLQGYIEMIIGVILAVTVIEILIHALRRPNG